MLHLQSPFSASFHNDRHCVQREPSPSQRRKRSERWSTMNTLELGLGISRASGFSDQGSALGESVRFAACSLRFCFPSRPTARERFFCLARCAFVLAFTGPRALRPLGNKDPRKPYRDVGRYIQESHRSHGIPHCFPAHCGFQIFALKLRRSAAVVRGDFTLSMHTRDTLQTKRPH